MTSEEKQSLIDFGNRLRNLRIQKKISQEKFADLTQLDRTYISGLERGIRNPSFIILQKIANCLEISINKLFQEVDDEKHPNT